MGVAAAAPIAVGVPCEGGLPWPLSPLPPPIGGCGPKASGGGVGCRFWISAGLGGYCISATTSGRSTSLVAFPGCGPSPVWWRRARVRCSCHSEGFLSKSSWSLLLAIILLAVQPILTHAHTISRVERPCGQNSADILLYIQPKSIQAYRFRNQSNAG